MGQKANPICLRLHPENKHFDSCWFSEKRYANSIHKDLNIGTYYNAILKQIQYPSASYLLEASPRKFQTSFVFLNPKQLREQSFRQLGNVNGRNRRRKQSTLFSTKKETTSLYGLLERKRGSLTPLPPYFFTPLFLQGLEKRESVGDTSSFPSCSKKNIENWGLFLSRKREKIENISKEREEIRKSGVFTGVKNLMVSSLLQVEKMDLLAKTIMVSPTLPGTHNHIIQLFTQFINFSEKKKRMPLLVSKTGRRFAPFLQGYVEEKGVNMAGRQNGLQFKKNMCSSMLALVISHYFVQKNLSGNFLSATSRFLLLGALFPFLKKEKDWLDTFGEPAQQGRRDTFHIPHRVFPSHKMERKNLSFFSNSFFTKSERKIDTNSKKISFLEEISFLHGKSDPYFVFDKQDPLQEKRDTSGALYVKNRGLERSPNPHASHLAKQDLSNQPNKLRNPSLFDKVKKREKDKNLPSHLQKSSIYTYHMESIVSNRLKSSCKILLFKAQNVAQNALFIAEEIVYQLQRRNAFRQIKTKFLQELANKPAIKGIRVTCVGRIGGRAKKAQRARGESFKMGQTSLHLFDSKVSFASKTALTPYGAVGVKVWVCWK